MSESLDNLKQMLDGCTDAERAALIDYLRERLPKHSLESEWGVGSEIMLSAISRSSDLTKRGLRGIIAEAVFEKSVLAGVMRWERVDFAGDRAYDFLIRSLGENSREVRIQVKLQRTLKGQPMWASQAKRDYPKDAYVVEVQKTRSGFHRVTKKATRPYEFGEFDILAVAMHPSTHDWNRFMFSLGNWLIPLSSDKALVEIFQPVAPVTTGGWTDSLETCLEWLAAGEQKTIFNITPKFHKRRAKKRKRAR